MKTIPVYFTVVCILISSVLISCSLSGKKEPADGPLSKAGKILEDPFSDNKLAFQEFKRACQSGSLYGCFKVGVAYNKGLYGVDVDIVQAIDWYLKAANNGFIPAQQNIANLYAYRQAPEMNDIEGYKWLELAMRATTQCSAETIAPESDMPDAEVQRLCKLASQGQRRILSVFRKRMDIKQIGEAENLADSWVKQQ